MDLSKWKLDLGCGRKKPEGYIGVDISFESDADVICDLEKRYYPFKSNSIDVVNTDHCIEHLTDLDLFLEEIHRICKPNAQVRIVFPHFSRSWHSTQHKRAYGIRLLAHYGHLFDVTSVRFNYTWISRMHLKHLPLYWLVDLIDFFANLSPWFCERVWCYWVGGFDNVEVTAVVRK
jgi:predicted SAM-dependent methyltransferase